MKQFHHKMRSYLKQNNVSWVRKTVAGVIFAAACFIAAFVLIEFHEVYIAVIGAGLVLLISAYYLLSELFKEKAEEWSTLSDVDKDFIEKQQSEFRNKVEAQVESIDRSGKAMYIALKKNSEMQKEQLQELEKKLNLILEEQTSTTKTIVKFNKENARQIAINERETMEHVMSELLKEMKTDCDRIAMSQTQLMMEQNQSTEADEPEVITPEPIIEADEPEVITPEPIIDVPESEVKIPETAPKQETGGIISEVANAKKNLDELVAELGDDPNATLSPEDIARLFAASGN